MKKVSTKFEKDSDEGGTFFRAYVAVCGRAGEEFGVIAHDMQSLQYAWDLVMDVELDVSRIQHVKMYEDTK